MDVVNRSSAQEYCTFTKNYESMNEHSHASARSFGVYSGYGYQEKEVFYILSILDWGRGRGRTYLDIYTTIVDMYGHGLVYHSKLVLIPYATEAPEPSDRTSRLVVSDHRILITDARGLHLSSNLSTGQANSNLHFTVYQHKRP